eukprot:5452385-Pyramimonas_sp.AAC.1
MEKVLDNRKLRGKGSKPDCRQETIPELAAPAHETRPTPSPRQDSSPERRPRPQAQPPPPPHQDDPLGGLPMYMRSIDEADIQRDEPAQEK